MIIVITPLPPHSRVNVIRELCIHYVKLYQRIPHRTLTNNNKINAFMKIANRKMTPNAESIANSSCMVKWTWYSAKDKWKWFIVMDKWKRCAVEAACKLTWFGVRVKGICLVFCVKQWIWWRKWTSVAYYMNTDVLTFTLCTFTENIPVSD